MKKILISLLFLPVLLNATVIQDDQIDELTEGFHSYGLLTYGLHSNTFHVRNAFLKGILKVRSNLKLFATLRGYKDTHIPATNYQSIQPNISLYDYGFSARFWNFLDFSLRGAAVYRKNQTSWLLLPALHDPLLPTLFDDSTHLIPEHLTAAGIRLGIHVGNFVAGYSQGDWRHSIPMGILAKYQWQNHTLRFVLQMENGDPTTYALGDYKQTFQLAFISKVPLSVLTLHIQEEATYKVYSSEYWIRLEQAIDYQKWRWALRELLHQNNFVFDTALLYDLGPLSLGIQASTEGKYYIGSKIDF